MSHYFAIGSNATELLQPPEAAQADFARTRAIEVRDALTPDMLALVMRVLATVEFEAQTIAAFGKRERETAGQIGTALSLVLRRPNLLAWLSQATGCGPLGGAVGRVMQQRAGHDHQLGWHDDIGQTLRRLAVTINLCEAPYEGGLFEMRRKKDRELLFSHRHTEVGTMLIFEVSPGLEHRVHPVSAGGPRRVFTGWFLAPEA